MHTADIEVVKDIPGYKVILKAVLRSQIQQLVEQLAAHTDEESVILTANVSDGTLGHLGSETGKHFLDGHDDMKSQFLGFCLKSHHTKQTEARNAAKQAAKPPAKAPAALSRAPHLSVRHDPYARNKPAKKPTPALKTPATDTSSFMNEIVKRETEEASESDSGAYGADVMKSQRSSSAQSPRSVTDPDDSSEEVQRDENQSFQSSERHVMDEASNSKDYDGSGVSIKAEDRPEFDMDMSGGGMSGSAGSQDTSWGPESGMGFDTSGATGNVSDMPGEAGGFIAPHKLLEPIMQLSADNYRKALEQSIPKSMKHRKSMFNCHYCNKVFYHRGNFEIHLRIHTGERPYKCDVCLLQFARKDRLKFHMFSAHQVLMGADKKEPPNPDLPGNELSSSSEPPDSPQYDPTEGDSMGGMRYQTGMGEVSGEMRGDSSSGSGGGVRAPHTNFSYHPPDSL